MQVCCDLISNATTHYTASRGHGNNIWMLSQISQAFLFLFMHTHNLALLKFIPLWFCSELLKQLEKVILYSMPYVSFPILRKILGSRYSSLTDYSPIFDLLFSSVSREWFVLLTRALLITKKIVNFCCPKLQTFWACFKYWYDVWDLVLALYWIHKTKLLHCLTSQRNLWRSKNFND